MNRKRLTRLAALLSNLRPEQLDMRLWRHGCGTRACAAGWAAQDAWFNRQGLTADPLGKPQYRGLDDPLDDPFDALAEFFDITVDESLYLFSPHRYPRSGAGATPADVIERINQTLELV